VGRRAPHGSRFFFAGWADLHDAIYIWERATGTRKTHRVGFEGDVVPVHSLRIDRSVALDPDGIHAFFSSEDERRRERPSLHHLPRDARPFGEAPGRRALHQRQPLAAFDLTLSPDGRFLHASALCVTEGNTDLVATSTSSSRPTAAFAATSP